MEIPNHIKDSLKGMLGYAEAENKASFDTGASMAFYKAEEFYKSQVEILERNAEHYKALYDEVKMEITTIADILNNYSSEKL